MTSMRDLPPDTQAMARRLAMPDFPAWQKQVRATGGCANPIRIKGSRTVVDAATGEIVDHYTTADELTGSILIPCGNRRAAACPACSRVHRYDTYQVVRAGLAGGKGVSETVAGHPAVFVTLTAPSFGPVHARHKEQGRNGKPRRCRPRRDRKSCPHGEPLACFDRHGYDDPAVGQALCLDCYDFRGAVLFNAHAGELWRRLTIYLGRELADTVGISRSSLGKLARLSFAKVAEYQARGVVHFHAVIRLDGPEGPSDEPPAWATVDLLDAGVRRAATAVRVDIVDPADSKGRRELRFGRQIDVQPISDELGGEGALSVRHVAGYVAKYVTKAAEVTGVAPRPIKSHGDLAFLRLPPHTERMVLACFELDRMPAYREIPFRKWAHMLGYRGHCATKSRAYSTTYGRLRGDRKAHREAERRTREGLQDLDGRLTITESEWRFIPAGLAFGERPIVDAVARSQQTARWLRGADGSNEDAA
jgi:hypothetical protein